MPTRRKKDQWNPAAAIGILAVLLGYAALVAHPGIIAAVVVGICVVVGAWIGWRIFRWARARRRAAEYRSHLIERHRYEVQAQQELKDWLAMAPTEFEYAVAQLYSDLGHINVQRIGRSGDRAVDVTFTDADDGGFSVVQCKRYAPGQKVGSRDIQAFIGMAFAEHDAVHAIFVTTADYTPDARSLGERHGIDLIDGFELVEMARARLKLMEGDQPQ